MVPHSGNGGCTPSPRKPSAAMSRIAAEKLMVACTINGAVQLGKTVTNIRRNVRAPDSRAAVT